MKSRTETTGPQRTPTVVVIDDDQASRESIGQMLRLRGYDTQTFASAEAALAWAGLPDVDCVVADVKMPGMDGEDFLREVVEAGLPPPVVIITGHGDVSMAVRCLRAGAYHFVEKPFEEDVLLSSVTRAVEKSALQRESEDLRRRLGALPSEEDGRFGMVGRSRLMQDLYEQIEVMAGSDAPVFIYGETGVGKELVSRAIHSRSRRARGPFVPVNAAALAENVLESELFGHAPGAFTGATRERDGKLVAASGGTLLLDEIENLSAKAQGQLLRVLDDGLVYPLGKDSPRRVDIRILATSKVRPQRLVEEGLMREDFFHRIAVCWIEVPPLRDHREDIPLLISHFLGHAAGRDAAPPPHVPDETLEAMLNHPWPGNVRELRNAVERMCITAHDGVAGPFARDESFGPARLLSLPSTPGLLHDEMERTEKTLIEVTLRRFGGEVGVTAQALGISRRALYERMKKYGLSKEEFRA
ncbi:MAG: sigma-54 dependent transcriptional regulator [Planctomycetota bacterium]